MYSLNAGRLRKKVDIYGYQEMDSELGGKKVILAKKATVWAGTEAGSRHRVFGILSGSQCFAV